jgi:epoxyqueuosine reductase QueG
MAEFDEKKLKQMILSFGASDCGFADCTELGSVPFPRAVSVCIKLLDAVVDEIDTEPTFTYYAHYKAVNELINQITLKTAMFLEQQGFRAYPIPASQSVGPRDNYAALFPHKTAATLAGLGFIGKSGLLIHKEFGPRLRLGTILTDAPLSCGEPVKECLCGNCDLCVRACPAGALHNTIWTQDMPRQKIYDPRMCSDFMSNHFGHIGHGFVCGICMAVCPRGKQATKENSEQ